MPTQTPTTGKRERRLQSVPPPSSNIFTFDINMVRPFVKVALDGLQGSGKSLTAARIAIGVHRAWKIKAPILCFDNERSAKFLRPHLAKEGIEMGLVESESLDVLQDAIREAERLQTILLIDGVTKIHSRLVRDYLEPFHRKAMEMQDRPIINEAWQTGFCDPFVLANCHIIFTGRATTDWANDEVDDERNPGRTKRTFYAKGMKLMGHAQTLFEPDYVLYMERQERLLGSPGKRGKGDKNAKSDKDVWREATILKDRSTLLDGQTIRNPTYDDLGPMFEFLLSTPATTPNTIEGDPKNIFGDDENVRAFYKRRDVALEELDGLLTRALPGQKAEEKQARVQCLTDVFGSCSKTKIEGMRPEDIEAALPKVKDWLTNLYTTKKVGSPLEPQSEDEAVAV